MTFSDGSAVLLPRWRLPSMPSLRVLGRLSRPGSASAFVAANAVAFFLLRPGVPDLWAARARASGVEHGVGLTYWFGWFGGSTPGSYSVVTPFLCAAFGAELTAALAAIAVSLLVGVLVRGSARAGAASWVAAFAVLSNLWCGRVPFLVGGALAVATLACVAQRRAMPAAVLAVLTVLASPVSGAFAALGLAGVLLTSGLRAHRRAALAAIGSCGATLLTVALVFGAPGPEPFPVYLMIEIAAELGLMWWAVPRGLARTTVALSALAALVVFAVPNGMGANMARLSMFCLPVVAVAVSRRRAWLLALLMAPIAVLTALSSVTALTSAGMPASSAEFYAPLASELDRLPPHRNHRLEVVGADHAAAAVLLDHAVLARGWETQTDRARNAVLFDRSLDVTGYRRWLDANAVGLVAVSGGGLTPERTVVVHRHPAYLREVWRSADWRLYAVARPTSIVTAPARYLSSTQATMTVHVGCACTSIIRVRWSPYLVVRAARPDGVTDDAVTDDDRPQLRADADGWTTLTTDRPGTYVLAGSG